MDGDIITYAGDKIYRVDTVSGEVKVKANMDHKSSFSITPPVYADGMVFVALSGGTVQAFNAATLESLWIYTDKLGGQPNCPLKVKNGYLYTGFWNSETGNANFVCLSITDEDPAQSKKASAPPGTIPARAASTGRALTWPTISCWWERTTAETATPARLPGCCFWTPRRAGCWTAGTA